MSEHSPQHQEHLALHPEHTHESQQEHRANHGEQQVHTKEHALAEKLDELQTTAEQAAVSAETITVESTNHTEPQPSYVNRELKDLTYHRTLVRLQKQLPPLQRVFSKVIQQPLIDTVSTAAAHVARPSGLLVGGLCALIGNTILLYLAKNNGFEYNYAVFFILFGSGFIIGLLYELVITLWRRFQQSN